KARIRGSIAGESVSFACHADDTDKDGPVAPGRFTGTIKKNLIEGVWEPFGSDKKSRLQLYRVAPDTDWAQLDAASPSIKDGYLHSNRRDPPGIAYSTGKELFKGPLDVAAVVRTEGSNIRLHAFKGATVIFNWEIRKDELRVIRPDGTDGKPESGTLAFLKARPLSANTWYNLRWL